MLVRCSWAEDLLRTIRKSSIPPKGNLRHLFPQSSQSCRISTPPSQHPTAPLELYRDITFSNPNIRSSCDMNGHKEDAPLISGIAHVNLTVPAGTLEQANTFYGETLGLTARAVPAAQKGSLAW